MIDIDFETFSKCDIKMGPWRYAEDPSTDVMCMAHKVCEKETALFLPGEAMPWWVKARLWETLGPESVRAHNAMFEKAIWQRICVEKWGWPSIPDQYWKCSAAKCAAHALPRDLGRATLVLNTAIKKDDEGRRIMLKLTKPRKPSKKNPAARWTPKVVPEDFKKLYAYCIDDVGAEACLDDSVRDLAPKEKRIWQLDQKINSAGIFVDIKAIKGALKIIAEYEERCKPILWKLSGGRFETTSQLEEMKEWLLEEYGIEAESLDKEAVEALLALTDLPDPVRQVLELRQSLGKTSTKKLVTMLGSICKDGRIRDLLMYCGALTGRWAGKGIQIHNFPRVEVEDLEDKMRHLALGKLDVILLLYGDPMILIASCLRGMIKAAPGHKLYVADYAAIEARGVNWLAGQESTLRLFREGKDVYKVMACAIFSKRIDDITKEDRQLGKQAVLGCGYQMGAPKFKLTCAKYKIIIEDALAEKAVAAYRDTNDLVVKMWWNQERAAKKAVQTRKPVKCGKIVWGVVRGYLYCRLPSGRCLAYPAPKIEMGKTPWGEMREQLSYKSLDDKNRWIRIRTYGGKLVENITQAVCRDVMAEAMLRLDAAGYQIRFTVHDEIVCEAPDDFGSMDEFMALLTKAPKWAVGFPINAEGWCEKRYRK